jgi:hypothetical protein
LIAKDHRFSSPSFPGTSDREREITDALHEADYRERKKSSHADEGQGAQRSIG